MINYLWLVPALPLAGAALNAVFSRKMPRALVSAIAVGSVGLSFIIALLEFFTVLNAGEHGVFNVSVYSWIPVGAFKIDISSRT